MYKIDLAFWYRFGTAMQAFVGLPWDPHRSDVYAAALLAKQWAQAIQPITSLPLSAAAAKRLDVQLDALLDEIREQDAAAADGAPAAEISIGRRMDRHRRVNFKQYFLRSWRNSTRITWRRKEPTRRNAF